MELFKALGLNWPTLISQCINFGILYWVLSKFALKPLLANIQARQQAISDGLANAQSASQALEKAQAQQEEILTAARAQAQDIIKEARTSAQAQGNGIVEQAKAQASKIVADGQEQVNTTREIMLHEVRGQIAEIVSIGVQNVIGETIPAPRIDEQLVKQGLKA